MFVVLMGVFSFLFASNPTYKLNLIVGLFLWDFFAEGTKSGLTSLHARGYLLTQGARPVVDSGGHVDLERGDHARRCSRRDRRVSRRRPVIRRRRRRSCAVRRLLHLRLVAIVVGFSLAASVLFLRYRDLNQVWDVVLQAGFFLAPIIYPLDILPERFHFYLYIWPPTPVIEFSRRCWCAGVMPTRTGHLYLRCRRCICLVVGIVDLPAAQPARGGVPVASAAHRSRRRLEGVLDPSVRRETVREHVMGLLRPRRFQRLQVLDDVSFEVRAARRSASWAATARGKSTLLKIMCGHLPPDRGRVDGARGRSRRSSNLASGWNPELDAIDNVLLIGR